MEFAIIGLCIIAIGALFTFLFYQWLKIKRISENPDEIEIDFEIYYDPEGDEDHVL